MGGVVGLVGDHLRDRQGRAPDRAAAEELVLLTLLPFLAGLRRGPPLGQRAGRGELNHSVVTRPVRSCSSPPVAPASHCVAPVDGPLGPGIGSSRPSLGGIGPRHGSAAVRGWSLTPTDRRRSCGEGERARASARVGALAWAPGAPPSAPIPSPGSAQGGGWPAPPPGGRRRGRRRGSPDGARGAADRLDRRPGGGDDHRQAPSRVRSAVES